MALKLPPLSVEDVVGKIAQPDWAVYVYFGDETDIGWSWAQSIEGLFARVAAFLCSAPHMAAELRDTGDFAAVVWGFGSDPEVVGLTLEEASDYDTVKATTLELVG